MSEVLTSPPADVRAMGGPKVLLMGPSGTGKTYSLGTLADWGAAHGKEIFVLFAEQGVEALAGYWLDGGKPVPDSVHWHNALTQPLTLTQLIGAADNIGKLTYEAVTKMIDPDRGKNNAFWRLLKTCSDFPDDRTGKNFGPIDSFGADKIFAIDSLTEVSNAAMRMQLGNKVTAAPNDYQVAQQTVMAFLRLLTQSLRCTFALTAHVDRQMDAITQTQKLMVKAPGKAISDDIPPLFSDVIYTVREGTNFYWDTAAYGVDTKTRSLGYRSKITPDFAQIMDLWLKRGGK